MEHFQTTDTNSRSMPLISPLTDNPGSGTDNSGRGTPTEDAIIPVALPVPDTANSRPLGGASTVFLLEGTSQGRSSCGVYNLRGPFAVAALDLTDASVTDIARPGRISTYNKWKDSFYLCLLTGMICVSLVIIIGIALLNAHPYNPPSDYNSTADDDSIYDDDWNKFTAHTNDSHSAYALDYDLTQTIWDVEQQNYTSGSHNDTLSIPLKNG